MELRRAAAAQHFDALKVDYVGSGSHRTNIGGYYNTALTPGPGDPNQGALSIWHSTLYDHGVGIPPTTPCKCHWISATPVASRSRLPTPGPKATRQTTVGSTRKVSPCRMRTTPARPEVTLERMFLRRSPLTLFMISRSARAGDFPPATAFGDYILGNWQLNSIFTCPQRAEP